MSTKLIAACLTLSSLVFCQNAAQSQPPEHVIKIIRVQGDPRPIVDLVRPGANASIQSDSALGVILIKGPPSSVASVERAIQELEALNGNTQNRDIELVIYVLGGVPAGKGDGKSSDSDIAGLGPVYKQLHGAFPFKSYQLLSTILMRSGQGTHTSTQGMMKSPDINEDGARPGAYKVEYDSASISSETAPLIHLKKLQFSATIPYVSSTFKNKDGSMETSQYSQRDVGIETDVDLREGQRVVVGTSNIEPAGTTLFIVVTARLL